MLGDARIGWTHMKCIQKRVRDTNLMVQQFSTGKNGPKVVITANIHGDECTGLGVIIRLLEELSAYLYCGDIWLFPSLNPAGLQRSLRVFPDDGQDLNRLFPGGAQGSQSQKHIYAIASTLQTINPDLVLDLHTDSGSSIPYVLLDRALETKNKKIEASLLDIAQASHLTPVWEYHIQAYIRYRLDKTLSGFALNTLGIPSLTLEVGPRRSMDIAAVTLMKDAVLGILSHLKMLQKPFTPAHSPQKGIWKRAKSPVSNVTGVIFPSCVPGSILGKGDEIAKIYSTTGVVQETFVAQERVLVLAFPDQCWVRAHQSCATLAKEVHPAP